MTSRRETQNRNNRRRIAAIIIAAAAAVGALGGVSAASATTPTAGLRGLRYVAIGDSYASGYGLTPYGKKPASGCYQAHADYPHQIAAELGLKLDDRTCAGASTLNVTDTPQVTDTGDGTAPVQADALSADTDIVTVTIGGNDLDFTDVVSNCIATSADGPLFFDIDGTSYDHCRDYYAPVVGGVEKDSLAATIRDTVAPRLARTFQVIAQRAPHAKVFVVGYPTLAPDTAEAPHGCFSSIFGDSGFEPPFPKNTFPFTTADTEYLHRTEVSLDATIESAARAQGFTYVSTLDASAAHSACAPAGSAWISGLTLTNHATLANSKPIDGTSYGVLLGALHPNTAGVAFLRDQTADAITRAFCRHGGGSGS